MAASADGVGSLAISPKKKLPVVIRDSFDDIEPESMDFLLSLLDGVGKKQADLMRAVEAGPGSADLPVPEVHKIPESRTESLKAGVTLNQIPRCFRYDRTFFAPLRYYADACDIDWVLDWNKTHPFLPIGVADLETVFGILEFIVKDSCSSEDPKLSRVMGVLPSTAPPFAAVRAIYDHWIQRGSTKVNGSILKYRAYPPDHGEFRKNIQSDWRLLIKPRKSLSDPDYVKRLFERLREIRSERRKALELLRRQREAQIKDERFVRNAIRQIQKMDIGWTMLIPPTLRACERSEEEPEPEEVTQATLPRPSGPAFLKWCARSQDG
jgi:hypothetical protein